MFDICIIGGGVAGLSLARSLPSHYSIAMLTKEGAAAGNTAIAQGGIAASIDKDDRPESHATDTMLAAADHADAERVDILVHEGARIIEEMIGGGLPYDPTENGLPSLGMEGAHSMRRILHAGGDQTGKMLMRFLMEETEEKVERIAFHQALELIVEEGRCTGVHVSDRFGRRSVIRAQHVVLATGGIGQLYSQTSNSSVATGDGLSLAYHAGAVLEDLEFVQFHPTILTLNGKSCGLVSEAVRGEGAFLIDGSGNRIMENVHPKLELAPRDVVARAIERHWQSIGPVFLDARHLVDFETRFPSIYENCQKYGIDPATNLMPVRPGAHFHMGGVKTDSWGATSIMGLYAIGEVASTGVHGANRLASNSLLEGLVFGKRLGERIQGEAQHWKSNAQLFEFNSQIRAVNPQLEPINKVHLKEKMTHFAGILRDPVGLTEFIEQHPLKPFVLRNYTDEEIFRIHRVTASSLIATAASMRHESRGGHYRVDFPHPREEWTGKVIEISRSGASIRERKIHTKETVL